MTWIRGKWNEGSVGVAQLISWTIGIITFAGSITYASYSSTQKDVVELGKNQSSQQATISAMNNRLERIENKLDKLIEKK